MRGTDLGKLEKRAELLALAFYGLMLMALSLALSGAPGFGFLFLLVGSGAHVGRAALEEFVAQQRAQAVRSQREIRISARQDLPRTRRQRRPARAVTTAVAKAGATSGSARSRGL